MKADIERKVLKAARRLLESQPDLFAFTAATGQSEWNIANHFANELHAEFPKHHCDTDVIKEPYGDKRPDVIIHRRGTHEHNLLVVEVKRSRADVEGEIEKIENNWFRPPLSYTFGAVVVINSGEAPYVVILENDARDGRIAGKRSLKTMTAGQRSARAKKASKTAGQARKAKARRARG
jgi:hypothetical protein